MERDGNNGVSFVEFWSDRGWCKRIDEEKFEQSTRDLLSMREASPPGKVDEATTVITGTQSLRHS